MLLNSFLLLVICIMGFFIIYGIIDHARLMEELRKEKDHYRNLSTVDPLTGVGNRRLLDSRMDEEIHRSIRNKSTLCFVLVDVDKFKEVNSAVGHAEADAILVKIANMIHANIRKGDHVFRYGGDEFAIVMPNTDISKAISIAQRVASFINGNKNISKDVSISISMGITEFSNGSFDLGVRFDSALIALDIITQASEALLKNAKKGCGLAVYDSNLYT